MLSGKLEAEEASSAEDRKEFKLAMFHVSFFLSAGVLFTLLSFLVPGASRRFQILCWQTVIVSFVSAVDIVRRHPVVWCVLRESGEPSKKI
jgi:hypothetical protein